MTDLRQKQDAVATAVPSDVDFHRELEKLVKGHLDGCMTALASCSSTREEDLDEEDDSAFGGEGADQPVRRRRRSDLEGNDLAQTFAARRRHSRILSRWVARQAEEMITTMERRNRESELMALAGLHTVSMLDSSFLRESRRSSPSQAMATMTVDRPVAARASLILQRWREIEDESAMRERRGLVESRGSRERSINGRVGTSESDDNEYMHRSNGIPWERREQEDADRRLSGEQSPDSGDSERERVRQIVRGWMTQSGVVDHGANTSCPRGNERQRAEWLGETERERVRLVREWVQMASQQRDARSGRSGEQDGDQGSHDGLATNHEDGQPEHSRRDLLRIRGRQAQLDLIMQIARERQRELECLSEHRIVSDFQHRNRIQSLLRGRFLHNGLLSDEVRPPPAAATELGLLRQRQPVSGLREGFHFRLESIVDGQAESHSEVSLSHNCNSSNNDQSQSITTAESSYVSIEQPQLRNENHETRQATSTEPDRSTNNIDQQESSSHENFHEVGGENDIREWQDANEVSLDQWHVATGEESNNWEENVDEMWAQDASGNEVEEDHLPEVQHDWHEDDGSDVTVENWQHEQYGPYLNGRPVSIRRINRFVPPDDDNVYSMELRELLSRRSVSNLLSSGFRESLDQLIQSYSQRQGHTQIDWDIQQNMQDSSLQEDDQDRQRSNPTLDRQNTIVRPPPPMHPPQPMWYQGLHHNNWSRHNINRHEIECDVISDLKVDMARLQQQMSHMQRMLETCLDMHLDLQRCVRQEVSAALNRSLGSKCAATYSSVDRSRWIHVRKGICCICCDSRIDSLLYRCGHMCSCSNCANELVRTGGKCPLCRAPIVEVIRAYSIL